MHMKDNSSFENSKSVWDDLEGYSFKFVHVEKQ